MALTLNNVSYAYAAGTALAIRALRGVDLVVDRGELAVILGPSGSGKSTLLSAAAGLVSPTSGEVLVDGIPLDVASGGASSGIGIVFQRPESQLFAETVAADVAFGPRNLGASSEEADRAVRTALDAVGLPCDAFGQRSPFTLSGGEARRAALAGVLAMSPRYLLLDEPTAGLDRHGRRAVREAIAFARASAGVVVVSHDPEEFLGDADTVLALVDGESVYYGDVDGLLLRSAELFALGTPLPQIVRAQMLAAARTGWRHTPTLNIEEAADALAQAVRGGT